MCGFYINHAENMFYPAKMALSTSEVTTVFYYLDKD